jgi:hypothetical protein
VCTRQEYYVSRSHREHCLSVSDTKKVSRRLIIPFGLFLLKDCLNLDMSAKEILRNCDLIQLFKWDCSYSVSIHNFILS